MGDLTPVATWDNTYEIEDGDGVGPSPDGVSNDPHQNLLNRTEYLKSEINKLLFPSALIFLPVSTVPDGYFECDGSAVSRATYADLFSAIGEDYGVGDGATTFNIPDYRGVFFRGWDNGAGIDIGRILTSLQLDASQGHLHFNGMADSLATMFVYGGTTNEMPGSAINEIDSSSGGAINQGLTSLPKTDGVNGAPRISAENRPTNRAVMVCIRYKNI